MFTSFTQTWYNLDKELYQRRAKRVCIAKRAMSERHGIMSVTENNDCLNQTMYMKRSKTDMKRYFNTEGQCDPREHYMVRLDERLAQIK